MAGMSITSCTCGSGQDTDYSAPSTVRVKVNSEKRTTLRDAVALQIKERILSICPGYVQDK